MKVPTKQEQMEVSSEKKVILLSSLIAVLFFILDQITKEIIVKSMRLYDSIPVLDGFFNITSVRNRGAAWGIFEGKQWFLLLIALAAMLIVIFFFI